MKKVLIAGASGLVGYAAARAFIKEGWKVIALSRRIPPGLEEAICLPINLRDPRQLDALND
ncbi:MAG: dependent epimerase/dehydratase family, partial [Pseudomonadota bacterium]